jgi:hypothetical protein
MMNQSKRSLKSFAKKAGRISLMAAAVVMTLTLGTAASSATETAGFSPEAYATRTVKVTFDARKAGGAHWDIGMGAPDPFIVVDGYSYRANRCQNAYSCTFRITQRGPISVRVYDADVAFDDFAGSVNINSGQSRRNRSVSVSVY